MKRECELGCELGRRMKGRSKSVRRVLFCKTPSSVYVGEKSQLSGRNSIKFVIFMHIHTFPLSIYIHLHHHLGSCSSAISPSNSKPGLPACCYTQHAYVLNKEITWLDVFHR